MSTWRPSLAALLLPALLVAAPPGQGPYTASADAFRNLAAAARKGDAKAFLALIHPSIREGMKDEDVKEAMEEARSMRVTVLDSREEDGLAWVVVRVTHTGEAKPEFHTGGLTKVLGQWMVMEQDAPPEDLPAPKVLVWRRLQDWAQARQGDFEK